MTTTSRTMPTMTPTTSDGSAVPRAAFAVLALAVPFLLAPCRAESVELSGRQLAIALDSDDGYAVRHLASREHGVNFVAARPEGVKQNRSPWMVWLRDAAGRQVQLTAADAKRASHDLDRDLLTVIWSEVTTDVGRTDLTVTVTIRLPEDSAKSYWDVDVRGQTTGALWQVDFPRVFGIRSIGDDQMCVPYYWGRLIRSPAGHRIKYSLVYPQPASMQFFAYWGTQYQREPELPSVDKGVVETGRKQGAVAGGTRGVVRGFGSTLRRAGTGAVRILTFWAG